MIHFQKIVYKNLLSVGEIEIEIPLSGSKTTGLYGHSGAGKSLFLDALSFILYNRAYRDIKKSELVNSVNKNNMLVQIWFNTRGSDYKVSRGIKPNIFTIEKNGEVLPGDSHSRDQQTFLEEDILGMPYSVFNQLVVLGASNYVPFMGLKTPERRKLVESVLGLNIFSIMNQVTNNKLSDEKSKSEVLVAEKLSTEEMISTLERIQTQSRLKVEERRKEKKDLLKRRKEELKGLLVEMKKEVSIPEPQYLDLPQPFGEKFDAIPPVYVEVPDTSTVTSAEAELAGIKKEMYNNELKRESLKSNLSNIKKELQFYKIHDTCGTCKQGIDSKFKNEFKYLKSLEVKDIKNNINTLDQEHVTLKNKSEVIEGKLKLWREAITKNAMVRNEYERLQNEYNRKKNEHEARAYAVKQKNDELRAAHDKQLSNVAEFKRLVREKVISLKTEIKSLTSELEGYGNHLVDNSKDIESNTLKLEDISTRLGDAYNRMGDLKEVKSLLREDGIKVEILKRYIPLLCQYTNTYLNQMNMYLDFRLDEEFNDRIINQTLDALSYNNYSDGQRQRIDLAVLLAWRKVCQLNGTVNTNLFVLDEIMDCHLDSDTADLLMDLMTSPEFKDLNIFVISHKPEIANRFSKIINFELIDNFTEIV